MLPPRKSLRLQNKDAEILTLPPEPRGTLIYEEVKPLINNHLDLENYPSIPTAPLPPACLSGISLLLLLTSLLVLKSQQVKKPAGPLPMDSLNMEEGSKLPSQLLKICSEVGDQQPQEKHISNFFPENG